MTRPCRQPSLMIAVAIFAVACFACGSDDNGGAASDSRKESPVRTPDESPSAIVEPNPGTDKGSDQAPLDSDSFIMPSRNIGCGYLSVEGDNLLRCDILSGLDPPPDKPCDLDWTGAVMGAQGRAREQCAGDTIFDASAPVLDYGRTWSQDGITCTSSESGLGCQNDDGHGFFLSRARWEVF